MSHFVQPVAQVTAEQASQMLVGSRSDIPDIFVEKAALL